MHRRVGARFAMAVVISIALGTRGTPSEEDDKKATMSLNKCQGPTRVCDVSEF
jgi:hypothetical protein